MNDFEKNLLSVAAGDEEFVEFFDSLDLSGRSEFMANHLSQDVLVVKFNELSDEDVKEVLDRALRYRFGPTGMNDDESITMAMREIYGREIVSDLRKDFLASPRQ